ncbi:amidohydrolase [Paenibacillus glycanilyticus]|uniref:Glutamate carboxypeptidase n=1 Tax=Paenibacillus glycanilyticus TaxID=126569 RepID=A0ABQ6GFT3_9BACL|nr:amidohydrolase [Paenibacillus glycanilyticus]GLX69703.1 glutamate carboxypeptidase [Paenibacillus glycanilyticus]
MSKQNILAWIDSNAAVFTKMAKQIWENPEVGYTESFASALQAEALEKEGFRITRNVGEVSTAFVAEYGKGKPIIGILGEFDALPGLSQEISFTESPIVEGGPGHGCGHNLLGTAGVEAAFALKQAMAAEGFSGTIRYYGCPAEELLSGKTYMARAGAYDDLDSVLTWHPGSMNMTATMKMQALTSVEFYFSGRTAHAGAAPHQGRSALDAVELMNVGANYLREHVPDGSRIHYTITNGGLAPNIVPDKASVYYFLRGKNRGEVDHLLERLIKVAQGAAMMTETSVDWGIKAGCYDTLPNVALNELMYEQFALIEPLSYTEEEYRFAENLQKSIDPAVLASGLKMFPVSDILPTDTFNPKQLAGVTFGGSSDVGDASWITPMGQIMTTCMPAGTPGHTWQLTAAVGSSIGMKGMHYAAKAMALAAYDLLLNTDGILDKARQEFAESTKGHTYQSGIPMEVKPPFYKESIPAG